MADSAKALEEGFIRADVAQIRRIAESARLHYVARVALRLYSNIVGDMTKLNHYFCVDEETRFDIPKYIQKIIRTDWSRQLVVEGNAVAQLMNYGLLIVQVEPPSDKDIHSSRQTDSLKTMDVTQSLDKLDDDLLNDPDKLKKILGKRSGMALKTATKMRQLADSLINKPTGYAKISVLPVENCDVRVRITEGQKYEIKVFRCKETQTNFKDFIMGEEIRNCVIFCLGKPIGPDGKFDTPTAAASYYMEKAEEIDTFGMNGIKQMLNIDFTQTTPAQNIKVKERIFNDFQLGLIGSSNAASMSEYDHDRDRRSLSLQAQQEVLQAAGTGKYVDESLESMINSNPVLRNKKEQGHSFKTAPVWSTTPIYQLPAGDELHIVDKPIPPPIISTMSETLRKQAATCYGLSMAFIMNEHGQHGSEVMEIQNKAIGEFASRYQQFMGEVTRRLFTIVFGAEYVYCSEILIDVMAELYGKPISTEEKNRLRAGITIGSEYTSEGSDRLDFETLREMYLSGAMNLDNFLKIALDKHDLDPSLAIKGREELEERQEEAERKELEAAEAAAAGSSHPPKKPDNKRKESDEREEKKPDPKKPRP
jgi:hypothetical protein